MAVSKPYNPYFNITVVDRSDLEAPFVVAQGKLSQSKTHHVGKMIYIPNELDVFLKQYSAGNSSPTILSLLEYAIIKLQEEKKSIRSNNQ